MADAERLAPDIWRITLPLPFRLRSVHVYLVRGEAGISLVDTGIDTPQARDAFDAALSTIGVRHDEIRDVYATHMHPDHVGMSGRHADAGAIVHIMPGEERRARYVWSERPLDAWVGFLRLHGMDDGMASGVADAAAALRASVRLPPRFAHVEDGDVVTLGDRRARVVWTPGHSDYHYVLVDEADRTIFTGDHLLPTITPNIGLYPECRPDPLAEYLTSLDRFAEATGHTVLPGHGDPYADLPRRVGELRAHHRERLAGVWARAAERAERGTSSAQVVRHFWGDRLNRHEARFALVEVAAHFEFLRRAGDLAARVEDGVLRYRPLRDAPTLPG